ncbi:phytosulfokines 3 isoform X2 [Rhododendron vialii]|uniref:phytosulfokines 3 isoform X2 n=1 Tax=Rhododendron vialii TaxID=182163 RepID=UPI00265D90EB|nr:phytosulfokines 3 isoform X2 [Rhododendron vialii]
MSKFTTLLILALLLCSTLSCTARREPLPLEGTLVKTQQRGDEAREHGEVGDESCVGVGEEECLMRRTLAAHVDYIYTQKQNP